MLTNSDEEDDFEHVAELNFDEGATKPLCWECFTPLDNDCGGQGCFCSNACQRAYYDE
jgi:hypothetical protein